MYFSKKFIQLYLICILNIGLYGVIVQAHDYIQHVQDDQYMNVSDDLVDRILYNSLNQSYAAVQSAVVNQLFINNLSQSATSEHLSF